jgi:hypothetical protein
MKERMTSGHWLVEFIPEDGARLSRVAFDGVDLLTTEPEEFRRPVSDLGDYERRPVFGYDDCFPSVERCRFPGMEWRIPDHGEVCWLPWEHRRERDALFFSVGSRVLPAVLARRMSFAGSRLTWDFEVVNEGSISLPFQHVMHPLVRVTDVAAFRLPEFRTVIDHSRREPLDLRTPDDVEKYLLDQPSGSAHMVFVGGIAEGKMSWTYGNGLTLAVGFHRELFPSIGIWWNMAGYPDEPGLQRSECAFEPTPGSSSSLAEADREGLCLLVPPLQRFRWQITWDVHR